jgi:peptide/nickel transport system permease protein
MSTSGYTAPFPAGNSFVATTSSYSPFVSAWTRLWHNRAGMVGMLLVAFFGLVALGVALGLFGQDWSAADAGRWEAASREHWFGTNQLGQDIFQRAVYSVRVAFEIGLVVALVSTALGSLTGALAGWYADSWADDSIVFLTGVLDSIPFYLFVAAVAYALQGSAWSMQLAADRNVLDHHEPACPCRSHAPQKP